MSAGAFGVRIPAACDCEHSWGCHRIVRTGTGWAFACEDCPGFCSSLEGSFQRFLDEHPELGVYPLEREHERQAQPQPVSVSRPEPDEGGWDDATRRRLHEVAAGRVCTPRLCARPTSLWQRLHLVASRLASLRTRA